ncbi:oligosaccharide flippase family protein [Pseudidiomarina sp. WS423]|uniref:oligosaccharide flippase family protein n=1 Tax=Pseudidiomarina sp. WS423 TaxID=3425124 RepID=UPI003D6DEF01
MIGSLSAKISLLLISIFAARHLGAEEFGKWTFIRTNISSFAVLLGFAVAVVPLKYISSLRSDKKELNQVISFSFITSVLLGFILCGILILISSETFVVNNIYKDIRTETVIAAIFLIFISLSSFLTGSLSGYGNYKDIALSNIIASLSGSLIIAGMIYYYGLLGLVVGYGFYYLIQSSILSYFFKKALSANNNQLTSTIHWRVELSRFFGFSVPALVSAFIGAFSVLWLFSNASQNNDGYIALGIFGTARIFQNIVVEFCQQFNAPLISKLSRKIDDRGDSEQLNFIVPWILSLILVLPFVILPEIGSLVFKGSEYEIRKLEQIISITMFSTYIILYKQSINRKIISDEMVWLGVLGNIVWSLCLFLLYFNLPINDLSLKLAYSFMGAYALDLIFGLFIYNRIRLISWQASLSKFGLLILFSFLSAISLNSMESTIFERLSFYIIMLSFILFRISKA